MLRLSLSALLPSVVFHTSPPPQVSLVPGWRVQVGLEVADLGLKNPKSLVGVHATVVGRGAQGL